MKRGKSRRRSKAPAPAGQAPSRPPPAPAPEIRLGRKWLFRLAALVLVPLLVLAGAEGTLRLCGYGFPTSFFRKQMIRGQECLVDNDQFGLRFFPPTQARIPSPIVMKANKPAGTLRIFIFGESAALGDPRPHYGAGRYLEMLLRERFPGTDFEVINTAVTAINSHAILPIAGECAHLQGDLWIVYMGNNEMVGPFGAATVFGRQAPPLTFVRLTLAIQKFRLGQWLAALGRKLRKAPADTEWHGMEMFMKNKVPPDDPRRQVVYDSFRRNLEDILRAGTRSGAKVLLSTVAVNLRDCPPFASTSGPESPELDKLLAQAAAAETATNAAAAAALYEQAARLSPRSAELQFRLARCLLRSGDAAPAREHFVLAADDDALPFRADSQINDAIRQTGRRVTGPGLCLCDAAEALGANRPAGIPGLESFYEHVHLNFDGNYRLALAWAEALEPLLPQGLTRRFPAPWASQATCEARLALTDWNRISVVEEMERRLSKPPFTAQLDDARRVEDLRAWADRLRREMAGVPPARARQVYTEALEHAPDDPRLHEGFAEFLEATGAARQAIDERQKVCEFTPHYYFPYYSLGQLLKEQGRLPEALDALRQAAALNPFSGEIHLQMGTVLGRQNLWEPALAEFDRVRQLSPDDPRACLFSAEVLLKLHRRDAAADRLREALRLEPNYWEAHYRLGTLLAEEGDVSGAADEFAQVLELHPGYAKAHLNLGVALYKLGRANEAIQQFDATLRLEPQDRLALEFKRRAMAGR